MKKLFCLLTFTIVSLAFSQQKKSLLQVTLLEKSKAPLSTHTHSYTYTVKNTSGKPIAFAIETKQTDCLKKSSKMSVSVHSSSNNKRSNGSLSAHESETFTVELQRNHLTKLDTWSCLEIFAIDQQGRSISNTIQLSQFIPDTNNFK